MLVSAKKYKQLLSKYDNLLELADDMDDELGFLEHQVAKLTRELQELKKKPATKKVAVKKTTKKEVK